MSRSTRSRSKERSPDFKGIATPSPRNMSGRRISPRAMGDKTSPRAMGDNRFSPRGGVDTVSPCGGFSDTSSYRSHVASDEDESFEQEDESNLDSSQDSVDHALPRHSSYDHSDSSYSFRSTTKSYSARSQRTGRSVFDSPDLASKKLYPDLSDEFSPDSDKLTRRSINPQIKTSPSAHVYSQQQHPRSPYKGSSPRGHGASQKPKESASFIDSFMQMLIDNLACSICLIFLLLLVVHFIIVPLIVKPSSDGQPSKLTAVKSERTKIVGRFEDSFKDFVPKFPSQSTTMLRTIKAACKSVMREEHPIKPGIIMLAGNRKAYDTVECIAKQVTSLAASAYGSRRTIEIKSEDVESLPDYHAVKKYLDTTLRDGFKDSKVALVHNLEKTHGMAAMLFHAFCDNENAPFKDTVIIFTVHVDTDEPITDEDQVEAYLDSVWLNHLEQDSRIPLLTRIANFVAIVTEEDEDILHKNC